TKSHRLYFQLAVSTPHTEGTGFGLLPTPTNAESGPPPRGSICHGNYFKRPNGKKVNSSINVMAMYGLLPTPNASDNRDRGGPKDAAVQRRIALGKQVGLTMMIDGQLNHRFALEMMGYPPTWCDLPSE